MNIKKIVIPLLICGTIFSFAGCGKDMNMQKEMATIDEISSTITAEMKANLMSMGAAVEEDFADGALPSYSVMRLSDENFTLPIEYDKNKLEDALVITHNMNVKSDMIVVLKAKTDADVPDLENYVKQIRDEQYRTWENYLPDQFEKVQQNMTKTFGRYVVYVTYDEPQNITDAVEKLFK